MDQVTPKPDVRSIIGNILLIFIALTLPGIGWSLFGWLHVVLPLLIFIFLVKYGFNIGNRYILAGAGLALLVGILSRSIDILFFSFSMIPAGYVLARSGMQGNTPAYAGFKGAATQALCWALLIGGLGIATGVSPYGSLVDMLNSGIDEALNHYRLNDTLDPDAMVMLEASLYQMKVILPIILPAIFLSCALFSTWITMVLGNRLIFRFSKREIWSAYRFWQLPDKLIWLGIGCAASAFLLSGTIQSIAINLLILLSVIYCFQGLAVSVFFMNKWNVPLLFRSFIYVMIIFQSFGTIMLLIVGIADIWFDFRKLNPVKASPELDTTDE